MNNNFKRDKADNKPSAQFLRKRKFLMSLPVLILPFLTMAFWALGGGKTNADQNKEQRSGLNLQLPGARLRDDHAENKLSFYEQADKDSTRMEHINGSDSLFQKQLSNNRDLSS